MQYEPKILLQTGDNSAGRSTPRQKLRLFAGVLAGLVTIYLALGLAGSLIGELIPDSWEGSLAWGTRSGSLPEAFAVADELLAEMLAATPTRDLPYYLFELPIPEPNAVAVPGGGIGKIHQFLHAGAHGASILPLRAFVHTVEATALACLNRVPDLHTDHSTGKPDTPYCRR